MIASIGRALGIALGGPDESEVDEPPAEGWFELSATPPDSPPELEFTAYAEECRVFGRIQLDAERLSDMLNSHDEIVLVDVSVESLADGTRHFAHEFAIRRDELMVVEATGPRGNEGRRLRRRPHPIVARLGPYEVRGFVHVTPGADVLNAIRRRKPLIPMTNATLAYAAADGPQFHRCDTLLFNWECADALELVVDEELEYPDVPIPSGKLVKDFTGHIITF